MVIAAVVSTAALVWGAGADRRSLGIATSPFGWNRVIIVHTLSTLVLSWWFARLATRLIPELKERWMTFIWAGVGIFVAVLTLLAGVVAGALLDSTQAGYTGRLVARIVWCMALQVPWYMMALSAQKGPAPSPVFSSVNLLGFSLITAVGVPVSFLAVFLDQQTGYARDHWQKVELVRSMLLVQRLYDAGSTASLGERKIEGNVTTLVSVTPQAALRELQDNLAFMQDQIQQLEGSRPSPDVTRQLAQCYLSVDRDDEAEKALATLANEDASAAIMLAHLCKKAGRKEESRQWAEKALRLAQQSQPASDQERSLLENIQMQAYDTLAVFAGEDADFESAEQYLQEALQRLPSRAADIHDRLSRHFEFIGELSRASEHQREAARLDPERFSEPPSLVWKMLSSGAPVGLARPQSSRYKH
jgi:hypothetical protein